MALNANQTASASSIYSREIPAANSAQKSPASTECSRLSLRIIHSVILSGSLIGEVSRLESTADTYPSISAMMMAPEKVRKPGGGTVIPARLARWAE